MVRPAFDIDQLTADERFALIERLWESLRGRVGSLPLSTEERAVIEARRAVHRRDPQSAVAWESVRSELQADQEADDRRAAGGSGSTD